jgi:hypothetical protein
MTECLWQQEEWEMRGSGVSAVEPGVTFSSIFVGKNGWRTQIRFRLSEGSQWTIR